MKNLILTIILFTATISFGQVNFENKKLAILNDIYYKTTKGSIDSYMKNKGFEKEEVYKDTEGEVRETYSFSSDFDFIQVYYTKDNKIFAVDCAFDGAINTAFVEMDLKNKGYSSIATPHDFGGTKVNTNLWSIKGSKLKFMTASSEEEKTGFVVFGTIEK